MTTTVSLSFAAMTIDATDPVALADFWGRALGRPVTPGAIAGDTRVDATGPESGPTMVLHRPAEPKTAKNTVHIVLITDEYAKEIERLTSLGAKPLSELTLPMVRQTTFADPEGNEFYLVIWQSE